MMSDIFETIDYKKDETLKKHTTMRVGGNAKYVFFPTSSDEIKAIISYCKDNNEKYILIGNGSNIIFSDKGYDGIVIKLSANMSKISAEGERIYAEAGAVLSKVANLARDNELTGMEFAAGIPGTIGGAVSMNAGAYGGEMKDIIEYVDILEDGNIVRYDNADMKFGYRRSIVNDDEHDISENVERIIIGASIKLSKGNKKDIEAKMEELKEKRIEKQPLEYPSSGSTFKRPEGYFAGKLIEDAGLKGYRVGGAMVSKKHAGFVINYDNATAEDVIRLIDDVRDKINEKYGVELSPEVKIIG
ncbi:MAG: UDP-N-acetylmuramate dehydrogenase [Lachnospiraceae bacterium]|nr:UDP-N-acetylmuramate dehydrogenase [Lachnospiraceae bacterium]